MRDWVKTRKGKQSLVRKGKGKEKRPKLHGVLVHLLTLGAGGKLCCINVHYEGHSQRSTRRTEMPQAMLRNSCSPRLYVGLTTSYKIPSPRSIKVARSIKFPQGMQSIVLPRRSLTGLFTAL